MSLPLLFYLRSFLNTPLNFREKEKAMKLTKLSSFIQIFNSWIKILQLIPFPYAMFLNFSIRFDLLKLHFSSVSENFSFSDIPVQSNSIARSRNNIPSNLILLQIAKLIHYLLQIFLNSVTFYHSWCDGFSFVISVWHSKYFLFL